MCMRADSQPMNGIRQAAIVFIIFSFVYSCISLSLCFPAPYLPLFLFLVTAIVFVFILYFFFSRFSLFASTRTFWILLQIHLLCSFAFGIRHSASALYCALLLLFFSFLFRVIGFMAQTVVVVIILFFCPNYESECVLGGAIAFLRPWNCNSIRGWHGQRSYADLVNFPTYFALFGKWRMNSELEFHAVQ